MSNETNKYTKGGQPIYKHDTPNEFQFPNTTNCSNDEIIEFFEKNVGKVTNTFHEMVSDQVHIDIHFISPTEKRDYYTLFTTGMSDKPMLVPTGCENYKYAELLLCLPKTWPLGNEEFMTEDNYWPIRWLKLLARLPHEYNTWLGIGHTIPNGETPRPYSSKTELSCIMLSYPWLINDSGNMIKLKIRDDKIVNFYSLIPIYAEEMEYKLKKNMEGLLKRLEKYQVCELLNINRINTCKNLFYF